MAAFFLRYAITGVMLTPCKQQHIIRIVLLLIAHVAVVGSLSFPLLLGGVGFLLLRCSMFLLCLLMITLGVLLIDYKLHKLVKIQGQVLKALQGCVDNG